MKSISILFFGCLFCLGSIFGQEELVPLEINSNIYKPQQNFNKEGDIHNQFIYLFDTIALPFIDDFTENHFTQFNAQIDDPNVTDSTWFRLENSGVAFPMGTFFMTDTTYSFEYDTIPGSGFDSIVEVSKTPLPSQMIELYDIDNYQVIMSAEEVWPPYIVNDSLWKMPLDDDTLFFIQGDVDLFQDSSTVYFVSELAANETYWRDKFAYHNYTYAKNIQTLGVVTFDGLDDNGYPYDFSSASATGMADILTSKAIDLGVNSPADSIYFSYLYQPGGYGEEPESTDSLVLEFWSPLLQTWNTVSKVTGSVNDEFTMELVAVTNPIYFFKGFKFRFINYGTLTGSLDVWHIDYVEMDAFRTYTDTLTVDWAFSDPSPSLIEDYTAMPWSHYEFDPYTPLKTSIEVSTYNSFGSSVFISPSNMDLFHEGSLLLNNPYIITSPNVSGLSSFPMYYDIPPAFWFDTILADTCAVFDVRYDLSTNTITDLSVNDTLRHQQSFYNYYSFDDGTAEGAYGLISAGAELAYQFYMPSGMTDTIRAIQMHFSPTVFDVSNKTFFLQIWDDQGGEPGDLIYTSDDLNLPILYKPHYNWGNNAFFEYILPQKVAVNGVYYIGWKQVTADRLNIGFDKNINTQDRIFYKTGTSWTNTGFEGSLMMRPVFVNGKDNVLAQNEIEKPVINVTVYPNPANDILNLEWSETNFSAYKMYDLQGKVLLQGNGSDLNSRSIYVNELVNGIYLLQLITEENQVIQKKITIFR
ncbi:MAG: hypothetical protein ACI9N1_001702 [Flavobacteriales bacterium]|jgi:hypothetical protein